MRISAPSVAAARVDKAAEFLEMWSREGTNGRILATDQALRDLIDRRETGRIQTVNLEHLYLSVQSRRFERAFRAADWWTADGWPLVRLAKNPDIQRVTGKGLCAALSEAGKLRPLRYALLGSDSQSCAAFESLVRDAGHQRAWCEHALLENVSLAQSVEELRSAGVDLVLVALGARKGEVAGDELFGRGCPGLIVGVGGAVGMAAGTTPNAPHVLEVLRLEWAFRLLKEPSRLWRRYLVQYPSVIFWSILAAPKRLGRRSSGS